jgi:hypothetical protein
MQRSAIIFLDKDRNEEEEKSSQNGSIALSRNDYRQIIKEAYQEGRDDALKKKVNVKKEAKENKQKDEGQEKFKQKGRAEAIKEHAKTQKENIQRLGTITARQDIELLRAESVFPFSFFTDTLIIDTTKVTISTRQFFATEYITTIPLKDLSDITVQTYLFLGTVTIQYMPHTDSPGTTRPVKVSIANLRREDAIKAKNILKGALVAKAEEIDIAALSPKEIKEVIHKFGESEGVA